MKIYTKTGDAGETGLLGGARVSKNHPRIHACGEIDELNSALGLVLSAAEKLANASPLIETLRRTQSELFDLGAMVADPQARFSSGGAGAQAVLNLELEIDEMTKSLPPLKNFILPGGAETAARLFFARAVCRRAERQVCSIQNEPERNASLADAPARPRSASKDRRPENNASLNSAVVYLNRLSDYLFVAARWVNHLSGQSETIWKSARPDA